ncbi:hypothetical protein Pan241w_36440 [Gimesia alba]|uniref:Uncharacterized protein n=1 Tax=Gimesia alba TaxID=2527973 RepID=A0A517RI45_9PLAN|nr:hypothetical protein [Gimesia alba]QDT43542.1 hypothetical protein Pan241w_36440 [Gimesia alba]
MEILVFFIAMTIFASICHGLWVIGSLFKRIFSSGNPIPQKPLVASENESDQDRLTAQRYLRRLYYKGKIPEQEFQTILKYTEKETKQPSPQPAPKTTQPTSQLESTTPPKPVPLPTANLEESAILEVEDFLDEDDFLDEPTDKKPTATPKAIRPKKHALPQTEPVEKRAFGSILNAFMEEKNIRWGELISGLLIVGSAIGLVVSLWSTLKNQIPYLPALLFLLATAAIHGAGLYTFKRWKLESTSRGLLLITVLLVPLNFLAAIRLSDHRPVTDPLFILALSIGFAAFSWMVLSASRILVSFGRWQLLIAVLGSSAGQIIISRMSISEPILLRTNLLAALPVGCFIVALASILKHTFRWKEISDALARELVTLGGLSLFAVLAPCWLLVWNSSSRLETFACLTPLVSIMEILLLGMGLVLHHRKENDDAPHWSLAGSSIAVFSALMMLMNFAISWPRVDIMLVLGIVNAISLTLLAIYGRFAVCHIPALISAAIAGLLGFHVLTDTIALQGTSQRMLIEALLLGRSAIVLISFAILTSLAAVWLKRTSKIETARYYLSAAGCFSIGSSLIAVYAGYFTRTDDIWCTLALLINAITFLFANWQIRKQVLSGVASALLFLALQHALCIDTPLRNWLSDRELLPDAPFVWGCLIHATSGLLFLIGLDFWSRSRTQLTQPWSLRPLKGNSFTTPIGFGSIITSSLLVPYVLLQTMSAEMHAFYAFWIMLIWITVALIQRSDIWFLFAQCAGTVGTLYTATAVGEHYGLWSDAGRATPRYWLFHIVAIAIWVLLGSAIHSKKYSRNMLGALSRTSRWNLQPVLLAGSMIATGMVLFLSIIPAIATDFELAFKIQKIHQYAAPLMLGLFLYTLCTTIIALTKPRESGVGTQVGLILSLVLLVAAFSLQNLHISLATIGFPVTHAKDAFGIWSWLCLGLLSVACLPYLNSKFQKLTTQGLLFVTYLIPFLIAGYFIEQHHTADALRWGLGVYALSMTLLILKSESLIDYLRSQQIRLRYLPKLFEDKPTWRNLSILGASLPLLVLTLYQVFGSWLEISVPLEAGAISGLGMPLLTFSVPILMLVLASVLYAIHFRSAGWMLIGSHLLAAVAITGTILTFSEPPTEFRIDDFLQISIYTGLALAGYGLFWLAIESRINRNYQEHQSLSPVEWPLIRVHLVTLLSLVAAPYFLPFIMNLNHPTHNWGTHFPQIPFISLISLFMAATCIHVFARHYFSSLTTNGLSCLSLALIGFTTVSLWHDSERTAWQINLIMEIGVLLVGLFHTTRFVMTYRPPGANLDEQPTAFRHLNWTQLICLTLFAFAFRGAWSDAYRPYPALMIASAGTLLYFTLGICLRKQILAYASLITALLGTLFVFTSHWLDAGVDVTSQGWMDLLKWSITTAAGVSGCWLIVDLYRQRFLSDDNTTTESPAFQQILARILTCLVLFYTLLITVSRTVLISTDVPLIRDPAGWTALFAVSLLLIGLIWDRKSRYCLPALFTMGICLISTYLSDETQLRRLAQHSGLALSGYAFLLSILWSLRNLISQKFSRLAIPNFEAFRNQTRSWLPPAVTLLAVYTMLALLHSVLRFEVQAQRWWSVLGTALTCLTFYGMSTHSDLSEKFKKRAILAGGLAGIYYGWALLPAKGNFYFLDHLIRFLEAVSILSLLTTLVLVKWPALKQDWSEALRKSSRTFLIAAGVSLLGILISETGFQIAGIPLVISKARIAVVSAALVLLSAALILMAAVPKYDPFQLTLKRRMLYVYASEIVLALLFLHIYLTMPELFRGYLLPYWPYIVIAIAFTGAGVGEFFERIGLNVLSEPLQRTGTFLPLLPALSFWIHAASRQASPVVGDYSMILLLISLVYVVMSLWRKSFVYTTLAALAGNGALWAFWAEQGQFFTQHPQLWLIPPALSVLIATHLNREKLSATQLTAIRYFSTISIYVSSTGDMFIAGVAENLWLPVILCGLSVLGMFAGMMFRVRAFLYVGASFLVLSIVSMIWHASQSLGHIWPWWAFGIGLGICILTLFGLFEKRKNEMQELVDKLKTWDR